VRTIWGDAGPAWIASPWQLIGVVWGVWMLSWLLAAFWARRPAARMRLADEAPYLFVTVLGFFLVFDVRRRLHFGPAWAVSEAAAWACLALVFAGFVFAWWARLHLGALWSGTITRKDDHRIVDTGPYGIVRHPIYTGIGASVIGTALALGRVDALVGAALIWIGFWMKARLEERFLAEGLGEAAYASYRARVPMLVPFIGA
jgi:protein-S-isoprenylcysteine O-methyltransferase Ste14